MGYAVGDLVSMKSEGPLYVIEKREPARGRFPKTLDLRPFTDKSEEAYLAGKVIRRVPRNEVQVTDYKLVWQDVD